MDTSIYHGCIPALMTPCTVDRRPDFPALVRKAQELMEAGMSGVVYCGSMGDWPLLTDAERQQGVADLCAAGIPTMVGTGAINTRSATAHAAHANSVGAKGLMVIPRVLSRGTSPAAQRAHFAAILAAGMSDAELPPMSAGDMYTDPGDSQPLPADLAAAIAAFRGSDLADLLGEPFATSYASIADAEVALAVENTTGVEGDEVNDWERARFLEHS